jgi:hypothetical protein
MVRNLRASQIFLVALVGSVSCAPPAAKTPVPPPPMGGEWRYEVVVDEGAETLGVAATFPVGTTSKLSVTDGAEPYVKEVEIENRGAWELLPPTGDVWIAPTCAAGCRVRYRFLLAKAAIALDSDDLASGVGGVVQSPPATWLLHPLDAQEPEQRFRFHVTTPKEVSFATGVSRARDGSPATFEAPARDLGAPPYSLFGKLKVRRVTLDDAYVDVAVGPGRMALSDAAIDRWVSLSGHAVSNFYGTFPIPGALLGMLPTRGDSVGFGRTMAGGGASILLNLGRDATESELTNDWVLTHEMIHLAFPEVGRDHLWIEEGLATYVEPLARARIGNLLAEEVWMGMVKGMPNGLPRPGDQGLDRTHTWGRTYWGGALFCLVADLEIRKVTKNRKAIDDALRSILRAGGNGSVRWDLARAISEGDTATGTTVLRDLYATWSTTPVNVDLDALWKDLGVTFQKDSVTFDDTAPLAAVRRSMTAQVNK